MKKYCRFAWLLLLILISIPVLSQSYGAGLSFYSHGQKIVERRTSLILNDRDPYYISEHDKFTMEFDVCLRSEQVKFGYIFRIIANNDNNFDLIIKNNLNTFFVINKNDYKLQVPFPSDSWQHISVSIDKTTDSVTFSFNEQVIACSANLKPVQSIQIIFGLSDFPNFFSNDVAPFVLRNVKILYNKTPLHFWKLDRHINNCVYDSLQHERAIAVNPHWVLDDHIQWKKVAEFKTSVFPQVAFDSVQNNVYILNSEELIRYSLADGATFRSPNTQQSGGGYYNELLFDQVSNRLLFYQMETGKIYCWNPVTNLFDGYINNSEEPTHAQHNRYISPHDTALYTFGGYGHYNYHSDFYKINLNTQQISKYDFARDITPRYLAAMGPSPSGDKLYILGGRGATMGRQELSPKNFCDLYEVDMKTLKVKLLFQLNEENAVEDVYSNSLLLDREGKNIYVLAYPNKKFASTVRLKRINLQTREVTTFPDSIPYFFKDITSFCDLYYSPRLSQLIAVLACNDEKDNSSLQIYTLNFPPLLQQDITQQPSNNKYAVWLILLYVAASIGIVGLALRIFLYRKNPSGEYKTLAPAKESAVNLDETAQSKEKKYYDVHKSAIFFLGGFEVFDREGKKITGEFTPTLKYMLALIILYSLKNSKGISSVKLQELLWFDKSEKSARNNRNVTLSKLRILLNKVGAADINNQNGNWLIELPSDVFCDYAEALHVANRIQGEKITPIEDLYRLLELLENGNMLPNIQYEWLDNFKTDFANLSTETLMYIINNSANDYCNQPAIRLRIADALLNIDSINEEALEIKCKTLVKTGKKGLAKTTFENFNKEYKLLLGEPYNGSLKKYLEG